MYDSCMVELSGGSMFSKGTVRSEADPWHGLHGGIKPPCSALTSIRPQGFPSAVLSVDRRPSNSYPS